MNRLEIKIYNLGSRCSVCRKRIFFWQKNTNKFVHYKCTEKSRWDKLDKKHGGNKD